MAKKPKLNAVERDLLQGMKEFVQDLKSGKPLAEKYNCRRVTLNLVPHKYGAKEVKKTRKLLSASQAIFAQLIGVSVKTVRAWESGKELSNMASRFLDEIQRKPDYWRQRLAEIATVKNYS